MSNIFCFNQQFDLEQDWREVSNPNLDWSLNPFGDNEWTFMLNRMEFLNLLDTNISEQRDKIKELILNWIINVDLKSNFVRTIDTAIRLSAWVPYVSIFDKEEQQVVLKSIEQQLKYLETNWADRHLLLNWGIIQTCSIIYVANEVAMIEIDEKIQKKRLAMMIENQFSTNGFHNESSTLYLFEVIKQLNKVSKISGYAFVNETLNKAKATLVNLKLNSGEIVAIGDSDIFDAKDVFEYLDIDPNYSADNTSDGIVHLNNGDFEVMLFNLAHGGGHGHFMSNHIELCIGNQHVLIDCGRYTYIDSELRNEMKSYMSHNTINFTNQLNFPINSWKNRGRLQTFPIEYFEFEGNNIVISSWYNGQEIINRCLWLQNDKLIIIDNAKSEYKQIFNFSDEIQLTANEFNVKEQSYYVNSLLPNKLCKGTQSKTYNQLSNTQKIVTDATNGFQVTSISKYNQPIQITKIFDRKGIEIENYCAISIDNYTLLLSFEENLEVSIPYYYKHVAFNCRLGLILDEQLKVIKT